MPGHFLLAFVRHLRAHKLITLINIASLAIGLTVFALAWLYVKRELSYDRGWPEAERIHRLVMEQRQLPGLPDGAFTSVNPRVFPLLLDYFAEEIESASRVSWSFVRLVEGDDDRFDQLHYVDAAFADILPMERVEGDLSTVLRTPGLVALSEQVAEALGSRGQLGQRLVLDGTYAGGEQEFEVGAIFRLPALSALNLSMVTGINDFAGALFVPPATPVWENSIGVWLRLRDGLSTDAFNARMPPFIDSAVAPLHQTLPPEEALSRHLFYRFQPVTEMHLNPLSTEVGLIPLFGDKQKVLTFAVVGILVLLVGCSNSASLSLAQVLARRREVGIRKACGAGRGTIMRHYLCEALLLALVAGALALALQALLRSPVMALLDIRGEFDLGVADIGLLLGLAALLGLLNAAYPAFVLSGLRPQSVLRPGAALAGAGSFRARLLLVGAQFSLAILFLSGAAALYAQLSVARSQPLGYEHRHLLFVSHQRSTDLLDAEVMANGLRRLPGVVDALPSFTVPNQNIPLNLNAVSLVAKQGAETEIQATLASVYDGFFALLQIPLLAGRPLESLRDAQPPPGAEEGAPLRPIPIMLNRRAVQALGFPSSESAVGQVVFRRDAGRDRETGSRVTDMPQVVVGVVEDSLLLSVRRRPVPEMYFMPPRLGTGVLLRYEAAVADDIQRRASELWQERGMQIFFTFVDELIESAFARERSESRLLLTASALALFLSCIGLYALAAATMARSVKEVGVRKVLGASVGGLVALFLLRFSRPVLFANLVAWPLAGWFVLRWIQRFPYQLEPAWLPPIFLGASLLVLLIAWLTVAGVTVRAARRAPIHALRYE